MWLTVYTTKTALYIVIVSQNMIIFVNQIFLSPDFKNSYSPYCYSILSLASLSKALKIYTRGFR